MTDDSNTSRVLDSQAQQYLCHASPDGQYLACLALRHLGHDCFGSGYGDEFYWTLDGKRIDPDHKPAEGADYASVSRDDLLAVLNCVTQEAPPLARNAAARLYAATKPPRAPRRIQIDRSEVER